MRKDDPRIEIIARAICRGRGLDPDKEVIVERLSKHPKRGPRWRKFRGSALDHVAAWDALKALEDGLPPRDEAG